MKPKKTTKTRKPARKAKRRSTSAKSNQTVLMKRKA